MQDFDLKYGSGTVRVSVPEEDIISVLSGRHMEPLSSPEQAIKGALLNPIGSKPLAEVVKHCKRIALVVSDYTRATKRGGIDQGI